jgi:hypothetical protein
LVEDRADPVPALAAAAKAPRDTRVKGTGKRQTSPYVKRSLLWVGSSAVVSGLLLVWMSTLGESDASRDLNGSFRAIGIGSTVAGGAMIGLSFALP